MSGVKRYRHFPAQYARMFIDTLPSGEYVTGADYDACSSRLHEIAVACANAEQERDELRVQVEAMRTAIADLRETTLVALAEIAAGCSCEVTTDSLDELIAALQAKP